MTVPLRGSFRPVEGLYLRLVRPGVQCQPWPELEPSRADQSRAGGPRCTNNGGLRVAIAGPGRGRNPLEARNESPQGGKCPRRARGEQVAGAQHTVGIGARAREPQHPPSYAPPDKKMSDSFDTDREETDPREGQQSIANNNNNNNNEDDNTYSLESNGPTKAEKERKYSQISGVRNCFVLLVAIRIFV